LNNNNNKKHKR